MIYTVAVLRLGENVQLRLELLIANNARFRLELRRWVMGRDGTWRVSRKRGIQVERGELAVLLKALNAGDAK